jgi:CheY-like chemotaxis protein
MSLLSMLLVDDDEPFLTATCRALRGAGYAVESAPDGAQALRILPVQAPDLLITDVMMPNGDGIELISAVRRNFPKVRILAISGRGLYGSVDLLRLARQVGADGALAKPFTTEDLLMKVTGVMRPLK